MENTNELDLHGLMSQLGKKPNTHSPGDLI